jgi:hypothetical protein
MLSMVTIVSMALTAPLTLVTALLMTCIASVQSSVPAVAAAGPSKQVSLRAGQFFGYYGDCPSCVEETRAHTNVQWIAGWGGDGAQVPKIVERAKNAAPIKTVIMLPGMYVNKRLNPLGLVAARGIFQGLRDAGVLQNVAALYPQDEPDLEGLDDATVIEANAAVRAVAAEFAELKNVPLAVIYSERGTLGLAGGPHLRFASSPTSGFFSNRPAGLGTRPGISSYDWVGIDAYAMGSKILGKPYTKLQKLLTNKQRLLLVPGGANPWREDPTPYFKRAARDPKVIGVVAFLWFDNAAPDVGLGVHSNGLAPKYRPKLRKF